MNDDSEALAAASRIPGYSAREIHYLVAVARGEGFYGKGWNRKPTNPKLVADTAKLGLTGLEGAQSKNWGAIQGVGSAGSFFHLDYHADGTPYKGRYKAYTSDQDAAADMARILLKPNVREALSRGDMYGAVQAQHANHYFELNPEAYYAAVLKNYNAIVISTGVTPILFPKGSPAISPLVPEPEPGCPGSSA